MGLVIFGVIGLYLLISLGVVAWAISYAKKSGKSAKKWGWGTALVLFLRAMLVFAALQFPVIGHCDSGNGWFKNLFESKGNNMKEVATKIATLDEKNEIWGLDFSPDGKYLAADTYFPGTVQLWDWQSGRILRTLEKAQGANIGQVTESVRYSPDGHLLAACHSRAKGDVVVRIWNTSTWEIVHDITDPVGGGSCNAIGFTPVGKTFIRVLDRISTKPGDNLITYNTDTWESVWGLRTEPFQPHALAISPDGKFIALGGNITGPDQTQIVIVDLAQRAIVRTIQAFPARPSGSVQFGVQIERLAWHPDGIHLAAGVYGVPADGADAIRIFDTKSGIQVASEPAPVGTYIRAIRYTPDGKYLIEAGIGKSVKIWDGMHQELLQEISEGEEVLSLNISPDGHYFAIGGFRKIQIWNLK